MNAPQPDRLEDESCLVSCGDDPWRWWRDQMPITEKWAYFDHAAVSPLPMGSARAMSEFGFEASRFGDTVWPEWSREIEGLRAEFASFLHCSDSEVALIPNTSFGINLIAEGLRWRPGDNIVIPEGEFPSNVFPWENQRRRGVQVRVVPCANRHGHIDLNAVIEAVDAKTRLVAASWVGYASGFRIELEPLVHEVHRAGALFFLDAIQGLGVFPLDLSRIPIDFLAADGHKWLLGPEGAGVAMIRLRHLESLDCVPVGWNSVRSAHQFGHSDFDLKPNASRFEIGSHNMVGMRALRRSLAIFRQVIELHGESAIADRVLWLSESLNRRLLEAGAVTSVAPKRENRSGIVTFALSNISASQFRQLAAKHQIAVSCRGIGVRASVHAYNDSSDIDRLVELVRSV